MNSRYDSPHTYLRSTKAKYVRLLFAALLISILGATATFGYLKNLIDIFVILILITYIFAKLVRRKLVINEPLIIITMITIVFTLFGGAFSNYSVNSLLYSIRFFLFGFIVIDLCSAFSEQDMIQLTRLMYSVGVITGLIGIAVSFLGISTFAFFETPRGRIIPEVMIPSTSSIFFDENYFGYVCFLSLASFPIAFIKKSIWKLTVVIPLFAGLLTGSRAFLLSLFVVFCYMLMKLIGGFLKSKRFDSLVKSVGVSILIIILVLIVSSFVNGFLKNTTVRSILRMERGSTGRLEMWNDGMELLIQKPMALVFGFGNNPIHVSVHNTYVDIALQIGLISLFLYFSMIITVISVFRLSTGLLLFMILYILYSSTITITLGGTSYFSLGSLVVFAAYGRLQGRIFYRRREA